MKNRSIIAITIIAFINFTPVHVSAYSNTTSQHTTQSKSYFTKTSKSKSKIKKPEYYRPGHSNGLQNYPGKTIDAGANTGMLSTNSSSPLMGNDITF